MAQEHSPSSHLRPLPRQGTSRLTAPDLADELKSWAGGKQGGLRSRCLGLRGRGGRSWGGRLERGGPGVVQLPVVIKTLLSVDVLQPRCQDIRDSRTKGGGRVCVCVGGIFPARPIRSSGLRSTSFWIPPWGW